MIRCACPHCHYCLEFANAAHGRRTRCPNCGQGLRMRRRTAPRARVPVNNAGYRLGRWLVVFLSLAAIGFTGMAMAGWFKPVDLHTPEMEAAINEVVKDQFREVTEATEALPARRAERAGLGPTLVNKDNAAQVIALWGAPDYDFTGQAPPPDADLTIRRLTYVAAGVRFLFIPNRVHGWMFAGCIDVSRDKPLEVEEVAARMKAYSVARR